MNSRIQFYSSHDTQHDQEIEDLLKVVYVNAGYTAPEIAQKLFAAPEVKKRGAILLAKNSDNVIIGMIIVGTSLNPWKQVATENEAEMQLLATLPAVRGQGFGELLCRAFEAEALKNGFHKAVLSTQPAMEAAHKLYTKMGYVRNPARDWQRGDREFWVFEKKLDSL